MSSEDASVISSLRALREGCLLRLEANEDWRALKVLEKAIGELEGPKGMLATPPAFPFGMPAPRDVLMPPWVRNAMDTRQPSQSDAAHAVIAEVGPLPINNLVPLVRHKGAQVAGSDPQTNLSSSLSRDGRFKSVRINGVAHWALKDGSGEAIGGTTGAGTPAAEEFTLTEGR